MTTTAREPLHADLYAWFDRCKRALPWRTDRDPYRVWISEAMLQQTRVETVIPYFARFLARFPTVEALARGPVEDVLACWSGLGYYNRARTLHAAAETIVGAHRGRFPRTRAELLELPGIGPYTAGAIASIAFDLREPLVDGNVARVFTRLFAIELSPRTAEFRDAIWEHAARLVESAERPGDWNQALMELGATTCTPRAPRCAECPLRASCRAFIHGRVDELTGAKPRRASIDVELLVLVVRERSRILLERRPPSGRMAGMWQLPTVQTDGGETIAPRCWGANATLVELDALGEVRHTITHHRIRARVARGRIASADPGPPFAWFDATATSALAVTGMTKKIVRAGLHDR